MIKKIQFTGELGTALASGIVLMVEPDTDRSVYVTQKPDLVDSVLLAEVRNSESFVSGRDLAVWDILDAKPIVITPTMFTGELFDLGKNIPAPLSDNSDEPVINNVNGLFYRAGTATQAEYMTKVAGSHPYLFKVLDGEDEVVLQVDEYGMNASGFKKISRNPTYAEEDLLVDVMGFLILSPIEGPVFMSYALAMGMLDKPTPGVDLSDGSIMIKAIQHVHRDAGVIGYTFTA